MIKITVISLGKLKEGYLREACAEYQKRLSRYCDLKIAELAPVSLPENPSGSQIETALKREAAEILKKIPAGAFTAALCVEGDMLSSEGLARKAGELAAGGRGLCFIIGSSYGLAPEIKQRADLKLSLSKMTFPHQLFRVMLLEQIYRAFKINEGSAYHK